MNILTRNQMQGKVDICVKVKTGKQLFIPLTNE